MSLAFILINIKVGQEKDAYEHLNLIPSVKKAYEVYGVYDIVLKVEAHSRQDFQQTVAMIRKVPGVKSTFTMIVMNE
jgi:DNA-binding Lrp family transcriptional regulator